MARKTIFVSDLTRRVIDEKDAATVTIRYTDARRGQVVLDVNASEVADLHQRALNRPGEAGGRRPQTSPRLFPSAIHPGELRLGDSAVMCFGPGRLSVGGC